MASSVLSPLYWCFMAVTLLCLVAELIVSWLCNSLINTVDSFHTLFIFLLLCLPAADRLADRRPGTPSRSYGWTRLRPLGVMVSALLLASLCISVSLDILGHFLRPHPIQRPALAGAAGILGVLFNLAVATVRWAGRWDPGEVSRAGEDPSAGIVMETEDSSVGEHWTQIQSRQSTELTTVAPLLHYSSEAHPVSDADPQPNSDPSDGQTDTQLERKSEETGNLGNSAISPCLISESSPRAVEEDGELFLGNPYADRYTSTAQPETTANRVVETEQRPMQILKDMEKIHSGGILSALDKVKCLLGPLLVLANGLAHLMNHDCLYSGHCHLYLYLDPAFSLVTVVILLTTALPYLRRYGFLLLQGVPVHIHLESLREQILKLPGVLAIHELHVWQLSESYTVASVHIHCSSAGSFPILAVEIKELFRSVGVHGSIVQPEFFPRLLQTEQMLGLCDLACGKECAKKLCCQWWTEKEQAGPPPGEVLGHEEQPRELVIENIYL
ncbi:ZNT1 protein, partial [Polyodon spathula]|nr:ZNT1 protein [Polyodon spathula]